ncbi:MAG: hypothetical protein WBC22_12710 [Sedimentisphaerales bacterium]
MDTWSIRKTKPIQSQFKANSKPIKANQSQFKPKTNPISKAKSDGFYSYFSDKDT